MNTASSVVERAGDLTGEASVLYVDDSRQFRELVSTHLERDAGGSLDVTQASDGLEALGWLERRGFDCVVSDYQMPGMDGLDLLESIRNDHPDLPFILFTSTGSERIASEAIGAGVTDYLQKRPGTDRYEVLRNRIRNAVERYRAKERAATQTERLEALIETAPVVLFSFDSDGVFRLSAGRGLDAIEVDPDEVVGESVFEVHEDREGILEDCRRALDGEPVRSTRTIEDALFESWYRPVFDDEDRLDRVLGVAVARSPGRTGPARDASTALCTNCEQRDGEHVRLDLKQDDGSVDRISLPLCNECSRAVVGANWIEAVRFV